MPDSQPLSRLYTGADAAMQQRQRTLHGHFLDNLAALTAFSPELAGTFGTRWTAAQTAAEAAVPGKMRTGQLKQDTDAVEGLMEQGRAQVQQLFYYVGRAFPHNAGRLDQYGKSSYEKARANHDRLIALLTQAVEAATRDAAALAPKGWTAANTTALAALGQQLSTANTAQEMQKGTGVEGGQTYIGLQNALYGFGQQVSLAAKARFVDDFAKRQLFLLTDGTPAGPETHELSVEAGFSKSVAFATALADGSKLHLRLLAPAPGQGAELSRVPAPDAVPLRTVSLNSDDFARDVAAEELGPQGQWLLVRNVGKVPVRVEMALLA